MPNFQFRLETVLQHRIEQEKSFYKLFIQSQIRLQNATSEKKRLEQQKKTLWEKTSLNVNDLTTKQMCIQRIEHEINCFQHIINTLELEQQQAKEKWDSSRIELKAMEKLKENAFRDWMFEQNKVEQSELDEWTVTRRKVA